jgi:hypothetical protein
VLALAFVACGGGDDDGDDGGAPEIRTEKGLAVALAAEAGAISQDRSVGYASEGDEGGEAPSGDRSTGDSTADTSAKALQQAQAAGLTVTGYGLASADADSAIVEFYFSSNYSYERPVDSGTGSSGGQEVPDTPSTATPITEGDIQAVIDAVTGAGVAAADIEFIAGSYYDPYYASATLRVTVRERNRQRGRRDRCGDGRRFRPDRHLPAGHVRQLHPGRLRGPPGRRARSGCRGCGRAG